MATHYVSKQRGNDNNNGTAAATPWLTLGKVVTATQVAGDIVYVGPGEYNETLTPVVDGTAGAHIQWIADPDVRYVTGDAPGAVEIHRLSANKPTANAVINLATNTIQYHDFSNFVIHGAKTAANVVTGYDATDTFTNCVIVGGEAGVSGNTTLNNCFILGATRGVTFTTAAGTTNSCVIMSGSRAVEGGTHNNTMASSGDVVFATTSACYNCMSFGGNAGFYQAGTVNSCLAFSNYYGFYGSAATMTLSKCLGMCCYQVFYGESSTSKLAVGTSYYLYQSIIGRGATYESGTATEANVVMLDQRWYDLFKKFEFFRAMGLQNMGHATVYPATDFRGRARLSIAGTAASIGPFETPTLTTSYTAGDYQTAAPGLKIPRKGQVFFDIPVETGKTLTVKVQVKHDNATTKPSIIIQGPTISTQTATCTALTTVWQELTVSTTTNADGIVELVLSGNDTGATVVNYFSDPVITVA